MHLRIDLTFSRQWWWSTRQILIVVGRMRTICYQFFICLFNESVAVDTESDVDDLITDCIC